MRFLLYLLMYFPIVLFGQGIINNGANICVYNSVTLCVKGGANANIKNYNVASFPGFIDNEGTISLEGDFLNYSSSANIFTNLNTTGLVLLSGATQQKIGGSNSINFETLQINNTAGARLDYDNHKVYQELKLTSGILDLNSKTLCIEKATNTGISRTSGYICSDTYDNGSSTSAATPCNTSLSRIQWSIATSTGIYSIPFISSFGNFIPVSCNITSAGSGSGKIIFTTYHTSNLNYPYPAYPSLVTNMVGVSIPDNSSNAIDRFWSINMTNYTSNPTATLMLTYDAANDLNGLIEADLQAQYWNGAVWMLPSIGSANPASDNVSGISNTSSSYVWTLSNSLNPLPVSFANFYSTCNNEKVLLKWSTFSESNNDRFEIEQSLNGFEWVNNGTVEGAGNSSQLIEYNYEIESANTPFYYRIKQIDYDGMYSYSEIIYVNCIKEQTINITINQISIKLPISEISQSNNLLIKLFDCMGREIFSKKITELNNSELTFTMKHLAKGIYFLNVNCGNQTVVKKVFLS